MSDIALTAAKIGLCFPDQDGGKVRSRIAAAAITAGQAVYQTTAGLVGVADATTNDAIYACVGLALTAAGGAGEALDILEGPAEVYGYTVSSINCGTVVYLSETAGAFADAAPAGTGTAVKCGYVKALTDSPSAPTRVFKFVPPAL